MGTEIKTNFEGAIDGLAAKTYHATSAFGSSSIKIPNQKTLAHFKAYIDGKLAFSASQLGRFDLGTCAHSCILEQDLSGIFCAPEILTKDKKPAASPKATSEWKKIVKENPDKIVLTSSEFEQVKDMFEMIAMHSRAEDLISQAQIEQSFFHVDQETGLWLKARPDILGEDYIADYKTCASVDVFDFEKMIGRAGYDISAAHYKAAVEATTGRKIKDVFFICQEIKAPYLVRVFRLADSDLAAAETKRRELLNRISVAFKDNHFPGYDSDIIEVGARRFNEVEEDIFGEAI